MRKLLCKLGCHNFADFSVTLRTEHRGDMDELHEAIREEYNASQESEHGAYLDAIHGILVAICKDCGAMKSLPDIPLRIEQLDMLTMSLPVDSYVSYDEVRIDKQITDQEYEYTLTL